MKIIVRWFPLTCLAAGAVAADGDLDALAAKLSNPVASLISLPFQGNYETELGSTDEGERFLVNIQPVVPIGLSADWNLISRTILPVISQEDVIPGTEQSGIGDVVQSFFFSPVAPGPGGLIWGVGPVVILPTASDDVLGSEKWSAGPTAVALVQQQGWTYGALFNHAWSFAGDDDRAEVNSTFIQPFISKGVWKGGTVSLNAEAVYDWKAEDDQFTVPLNLQISQILPVAGQLTSFALGYKHYVAGPDTAPDWGIRFSVTLLFPR
jgi:hypothetical protein